MRNLSLLLALSISISALAQEVVQTKDGPYILLKPDGNWSELKELTGSAAKSKNESGTAAVRPGTVVVAAPAPGAELANTEKPAEASTTPAGKSTGETTAKG